ncbi:hypothetical protein GGI42DRAFT_265867 [Trichoderma sp. SZMC 28013]
MSSLWAKKALPAICCITPPEICPVAPRGVPNGHANAAASSFRGMRHQQSRILDLDRIKVSIESTRCIDASCLSCCSFTPSTGTLTLCSTAHGLAARPFPLLREAPSNCRTRSTKDDRLAPPLQFQEPDYALPEPDGASRTGLFQRPKTKSQVDDLPPALVRYLLEPPEPLLGECNQLSRPVGMVPLSNIKLLGWQPLAHPLSWVDCCLGEWPPRATRLFLEASSQQKRASRSASSAARRRKQLEKRHESDGRAPSVMCGVVQAVCGTGGKSAREMSRCICSHVSECCYRCSLSISISAAARDIASWVV